MSNLFQAVCNSSSFPNTPTCGIKTDANSSVFFFPTPEDDETSGSASPAYSSHSEEDSVLSVHSPLNLAADDFDYDVDSMGSDDAEWDGAIQGFDSLPGLMAVKSEPVACAPVTAAAAPRVHRKAPSSSMGSGPRRLHACTWCPKKFVTTGHLKQHVRIHTGDRPFKCSWCDKAFAQCGDLKRHERIHTGEKPFKCDVCDKAFAQCGNLKKHERIHSREAVSEDAAETVAKLASKLTGGTAVVYGGKAVRAPRPRPVIAVAGSAVDATVPTVKAEPVPCDNVQDSAVVPSASAPPAAHAGAAPKLDRLDRPRRSTAQGRDTRMRKKDYVVALEAKVIDMESRDAALRSELDAVRAQLSGLQSEHQLLLRTTAAAAAAAVSA